jgi:hypothetical protein
VSIAPLVAKIILLAVGLLLGFGAMDYWRKGLELGKDTVDGDKKIIFAGWLVIIGTFCSFTAGCL